jgi:hypothetical protein
MAFKLKSPYKIDPVAKYEVPFTPDNAAEDKGKTLIAKANDNSTMIINKNVKRGSALEKNAVSHEGRHIKDMQDNKVGYDSFAVYEDMDGDGKVKVHPRSTFDESDKGLAWEAPAYKDGNNLVEHDLRPKPNKLSGPPSMQPETPIAFKVMGSRHSSTRSKDQEKVSANERFAMYSPLKKWGGPSYDGDISGNNPEGDDKKKEAKANAEANLAKMNYNQETMPDGRIRFYKSAEGSATGTITNPGGVDDDSKPSSGTVRFEDAYKNADKEKYPTLEEFTIAAKAYNEKMKKPTSSTKIETATASDEYFKDAPIITTTTTENPPKKKKKCPPGFAFSGSRGCVKMPKVKGKKRYKKLKQKLSSTKKSTECVFGQKC